MSLAFRKLTPTVVTAGLTRSFTNASLEKRRFRVEPGMTRK
jgi:hypothetical protein